MKFETRHASHPSIIPTANTEKLRELYHISGMFTADDVNLTFSHIERMIVGGVMPVTKSIELNEVPALNKGPFLARRELGERGAARRCQLPRALASPARPDTASP